MNKQQKLLPDEMNFAKEIVGVPVEEEMQESFLAYSLSVITSRAIPDVKDGIKACSKKNSLHDAKNGTQTRKSTP